MMWRALSISPYRVRAERQAVVDAAPVREVGYVPRVRRHVALQQQLGTDGVQEQQVGAREHHARAPLL